MCVCVHLCIIINCVYFVLPRKFLRDISNKCVLNEDNQKQIIEKISDSSNIPIEYSKQLGVLVKKRIEKLRAQLKRTREGFQQAMILASTWEFTLLPADLVYRKIIQEREKLKSTKKSLYSLRSVRAYCSLQARCKKLERRVLKLLQKLLSKASKKLLEDIRKVELVRFVATYIFTPHPLTHYYLLTHSPGCSLTLPHTLTHNHLLTQLTHSLTPSQAHSHARLLAHSLIITCALPPFSLSLSHRWKTVKAVWHG